MSSGYNANYVKRQLRKLYVEEGLTGRELAGIAAERFDKKWKAAYILKSAEFQNAKEERDLFQSSLVRDDLEGYYKDLANNLIQRIKSILKTLIKLEKAQDKYDVCDKEHVSIVSQMTMLNKSYVDLNKQFTELLASIPKSKVSINEEELKEKLLITISKLKK